MNSPYNIHFEGTTLKWNMNATSSGTMGFQIAVNNTPTISLTNIDISMSIHDITNNFPTGTSLTGLVTVNGTMYASGVYNNNGFFRPFVASYNDSTGAWTLLPSLNSTNVMIAQIWDMTSIGNTLYIGGSFTSYGDETTARPFVRYYNALKNVWVDITGNLSTYNGHVRCLTSIGSTLFAGGTYMQPGTYYVPFVASYTSSTGTFVNIDILSADLQYGVVNTFTTIGTTVYFGLRKYANNLRGDFVPYIMSYTMTSTIVNTLTGGALDALTNSEVVSLSSNDGGVYASCNGGTVNHIIYYNGITWNTLSGGPTDNGLTCSIQTINNTLYAGGYTYLRPSTPVLMAYDGASWVDMNLSGSYLIPRTTYAPIHMTSYHGSIYIGVTDDDCVNPSFILSYTGRTLSYDMSSSLSSGSMVSIAAVKNDLSSTQVSVVYPPQNVSLSGGIVVWDPAPAADVSYTVYVSTNAVGTTGASPFDSTGLATPSSVVAVTASYGGVESVKTWYISPPQNLSLSGITLSWDAAPANDVTYNIYHTTATGYTLLATQSANSFSIQNFVGLNLTYVARSAFNSIESQDSVVIDSATSFADSPNVDPAVYIRAAVAIGSDIATLKDTLITNAASLTSPVISLPGFDITPFLSTDTSSISTSQDISMFLPNSTLATADLPVADTSVYFLGAPGSISVLNISGVETTIEFDISSITISGQTVSVGGTFVLFGRPYTLVGCGSALIIPNSFIANLSGATIHDGSANLTWTDVSSADSFQVEDENGNEYPIISLVRSSGTVSAVVSGLQPLYNTFYIRAMYDASGSWAAGSVRSTDSITFISDVYGPPPPPWSGSDVQVVDTSNGSVSVSWNPATGSPAYTVVYSGDMSGSATGGSPLVISGFSNGQNVSFYVNAVYTDASYGGTAQSDSSANLTIFVAGGGGGGSGAVVPCFLANAPVLTPTGYTKISKLAEGDKVMTGDGRVVAIQKVSHTRVAAGPSVNPYVIPKGLYGATQTLLISPDHRVSTANGMLEAKHLGLEQNDIPGVIDYYNLELPSWSQDTMVVAGVVVESLAPVRRITMTLGAFKKALVAQYGELTPAVLAKVQKTCRLLADGRVECPVLPKKESAYV